MKKFLFLMLGVALFACTQQKGFKIDVSLEGAEGQILLEERVAGKLVAVDTAEVVDGIAVIEGETSYPKEYFLSVLGERAKAMVFVENTAITITGKVDSITDVKVSGSVTHDQYTSMTEELNPMIESYMEPYNESRQAQAAGDTAKASVLMKKAEEQYEASEKKMEDIQLNFLKNNPGSYYAPAIINNIQRGLEIEELDKVLGSLDSKLDSVSSIVKLKERIVVLKTVAVGQIAPDFTQNDPEGNPIKFSEIYEANELTLLDFWAAWCGPCRGENPNVVAVYNDYNEQGFTVYGVSFDNKKEDWLKAIEDDGLVWKQVSMLKGWDNEARTLYAVNGIPHSLLVDKTGKIIAKDKRGKELGETVETFFAK